MKRGLAHPEPSVAAGQDPRSYARLMSAVYDATMSGARAPMQPRRVIWDSWQRMISKGLRPDRPIPPPAGRAEIESLRQTSGLTSVVDRVTGGLSTLIDSGENLVAITNDKSTVLWRAGPSQVLRNAEKLGFVDGAQWAEAIVGTNAMGTALVSQRAVQTFCAEHYNRSQHPWTCAASPIRNPCTGKIIGTIDVTGPASTVHPTTIALIDAVARLAESHLREQRDLSLNLLRTVAAPMLSRIGAPAAAVDAEGWVAAVDSMPPQSRILLPAEMAPGHVWVPSLGLCDVETLPGGWLIRPIEDDAEQAGAHVTLNLRTSAAPMLSLSGRFGTWQHDISLRHAEILLILATHPDGRSAQQLADALYGDPIRVGAIRVEMSRLRKQFAGILSARPYRFASATEVKVLYPDDCNEVLAGSTAPAIRTLRDHLLRTRGRP
ncbi:helix-turn-helix domain-containing protein [Mycolicibacterium vaccae]|uniref:helix-turn-helix domain-containing protein n=1 Tax=Mycolicibacterium vaccae TaxID=1810 RepID=UPI00058FE1D3|nr:helix-turn-helix domain-containing protein [Mycolicibacterium vaccae]